MAKKKAKAKPDVVTSEGKVSSGYYNIGKASFNIDATCEMSEDEFVSLHKGKVTFDLRQAYQAILKLKS